MDTWMMVAISIPKILSLPWLLLGLDDLVSGLLDRELGCEVGGGGPAAAVLLGCELVLLSEGAAGLEIGVDGEGFSEGSWGGGELFVLELSALFGGAEGGFALVSFDESTPVDG